VDKAEDHIQIDATDRVSIYRDGVPWFSGIVTDVSSDSGPSAESISFTIQGPWYFLTEFEFQQRWRMLQGGVPAWVYSPHVIMNRVPADQGSATSFVLATTRQFIIEVLKYVLDQCSDQGIAAPFQYTDAGILLGTDITAPVDEAEHITAAECIRRALRIHPEAVLWCDHSTSPPTLYIAKHADLDALTFTFLAENSDLDAVALPVSSISVNPAYERVRDAVVILYNTRGTYAGVTWMTVNKDAWPTTATGREMSALSASINLDGGSQSFTKSEITCTPFDDRTSPLDDEWWAQRDPSLARDDVSGVSIHPDSVLVEVCTDKENQLWAEVLPGDLVGYELVEGQVAPWMRKTITTTIPDTLVPAVTQLARVSALCSHVVSDAATATSKLHDVPLKHQFTFTNLKSGLYSIQSEDSVGDPLPPISSATQMGVARHLQEWLSVLQYRGSLTVELEEVPAGIDLGNVVNITGGDAAWSTMNGLIQSVRWDIGAGTISVSFGAPEHLGMGDLVDLLRFFRDRKRWTNAFLQNEGTP
jgi:hypothetical protein